MEEGRRSSPYRELWRGGWVSPNFQFPMMSEPLAFFHKYHKASFPFHSMQPLTTSK